MKKNMGSNDRSFRLILGITLLIFFFSGVATGFLNILFIVLGVVFLGTSFFGFCPLYEPFGISTCKVENHS